MTSLHHADVRVRLIRYLNRRVMPKHLDGKQEARDEELDAMVRRIMRAAPSGERLADWFAQLSDRLDETAQTRAWPSVSEIGEAARAISSGMVMRDMTGDPEPDRLAEHRIAARKIKAGEPVGDGWLWGRNAVVMLARGLVERADIDRYRAMLRRSMAGVWGDEAADRAISGFAERHAAAEEAYRQHQNREAHRVDTRGAAVPSKRAEFAEDI